MIRICTAFVVMLAISINLQVVAQDKGQSFRESVSLLKKIPESKRGSELQKLLEQFPHSPVYEGDSVVTVFWTGTAKKVQINGDIQHGWSKPEKMDKIECKCPDDLYFISYHLPKDVRADYQFIINDKYTVDPRNPSITPSGFGPHSEIAMPGFHKNLVMLPRAEVAKGRIDTLTFTPSNKQLKPRKIKVYLPAVENTNMPLLLVYDGIEAIDFMEYRNVLDNMIADKKIRPVLVAFMAPGDREGESIGLFTDEFINCLCDDFIPFIGEKYSISMNPQDHGITGISAGGHLALRTVFTRPDVIACAAGQSPSITDKLVNKVITYSERSDRPLLKIYFDVGRYDLENGPFSKPFVEDNAEFSKLLEQKKIPHVFHIFPDGHSWAGWRQHTDEILMMMFGNE